MSNVIFFRQLKKKTVTFFQAVMLIVGLQSLAMGHPLGNFTISHFTRLEIAPEQIHIRYIEMAEISTFQEFEISETNHNRTPDKEELEAYGQRMSQQYAQGLELMIDGKQLPVTVERQQTLWQSGAEGLPNLRVECELTSNLTFAQTEAIHRLRFEDKNRRERSGWSEIVVIPKSGISVFDSSAFGNGISNELKTFPPDPLASMLTEQTAESSFARGAAPVGSSVLKTRNGHEFIAQSSNPLAKFITAPNHIFEIGLLGLMMAAVFYSYRRRQHRQQN
jgi:nickel/cobalt transporter (NicO) family protein